MNIGERIKLRRKELGLSVDQVAEKLNKNRATIYRYESNEIENLPINILEPLANVLNTTPAYLMGWEDTSSKSNPNNEIQLSTSDKTNLRTDEENLLKNYNKLNTNGKSEANKRIHELTEINKYTDSQATVINLPKNDFEIELFAAHNDGIDEETNKRNIEKIMAKYAEMHKDK